MSAPDNHNKKHNSFDAINKAFGKTPKWRKREISQRKWKQEVRDKMIASVKNFGDDDKEFNEDAFSSLFDDKDKPKPKDIETTDTKEEGPPTVPVEHKERKSNRLLKKEEHIRRKSIRLSKRKRKQLYKSLEQSPAKRRKLTEEEQFTDKDFADKGIIIQTVHSKPKPQGDDNSNSAKTKVSKTQTSNAKKTEIVSQIHRFELTQLMIDNIPRDYDENTLNKYMVRRCSIECVDIHLLHNKMDDTKCGRAMITFVSPNDCALAYKCLLNEEISPDHILSVKAISHKYDQTINHNKERSHEKDSTLVATNKRCKVLKLSNLHWKTSQDDIINFFDSVAVPSKVHIHLTSNGYPTGDAKVEFKSSKHVDEALRVLNGEKILKREISLNKAISKQIFGFDGKEFMNKTLQIAVFNVSGGVEEDDLKQFIVEECGSDCVATDIHLIHHLELFTTGYAFCKFATHEITNKVVKCLNNKVLQDRALRVIWSKPPRGYRLRKELRGKTKVISCTNLRYDVTEKDIREFVHNVFQYNIGKIKIFENAKGFRYGMAKLWFRSCEHAKNVVDALNGKQLKERVVRMNYWEERDGKRGRGGRNKGNKSDKSNKAKKGNKRNQGKKLQNNWNWNDKWFEGKADHSGDAKKNTNKTDLKVPQRLLDQLL